ncbi:MAG: dUTP diphosphatase [Candidatus Woesearchaeota archaeon]
MRGFEKVSRVAYDEEIRLPERSTSGSAGYDFFAPYRIEVPAKSEILVRTGIKAYMEKDEALFVYPRSSQGIKKGLMLKNTVGIIDSDYYDNPDNEGEILCSLYNFSDKDVEIPKGAKMIQGIFQKILLADHDSQMKGRNGGLGSTGE